MDICITGASSGIGKELATQLIKNNHRVWGIARNKDLLEGLKNGLSSDNFYYTASDASKREEVFSAFQDMEKNKFFPEIIILAAGVFLDDINPVFNYGILQKNIDTNLYGAMNFVDIFLPKFLKRKSGQFIAISSTAALKPSLRGIGYPASKAALGIAFRGLDLAYRKQNIFFSVIYLGPVATRMWDAKKSFIVSDTKQIASAIKKVMRAKKAVYYIPFWSTLISRLSFLPDSWYIALTELFR